MGELRDIKDAVQPSDTLLVVDAMTGQEAAGLVRSFNEAASLTGACFLDTARLQDAEGTQSSDFQGARQTSRLLASAAACSF